MVAVVEPGEDGLGIVRGLAGGAVRRPGDGPPEGATPAQLAALAERLGQSLPADLQAWLSAASG